MDEKQGITTELTACPDCGAPFTLKRNPLMELLVHYEEGCPATQVCVVIGITKDRHVFSYPEFKPTPQLPDLPSLLRYMADVVQPE